MSEYQYNPAYEESLRTASGWQSEACQLRQELAQARSIITDAFCAAGVKGEHDETCKAARWARQHRYLPATHPARAMAPKCNCWVGRAAEFLKEPVVPEAPRWSLFPRHAGYCKPELGCTCFVHTMKLNGRL